jgi:hypothetical protein
VTSERAGDRATSRRRSRPSDEQVEVASGDVRRRTSTGTVGGDRAMGDAEVGRGGQGSRATIKGSTER